MTHHDPGAPIARAALRELQRLTAEARDRYERGDYVEAMGSLAAIDPLASLLQEHCSAAWSNKELPPAPDSEPSGCYL